VTTTVPERRPLLSHVQAWFYRSLGAPWVTALAVAAIYGLYVLWRLSALGGDPSLFIVAGPPPTNPRATFPNVHVLPPGYTYDGQFFYRLALEPWSSARTAFGVTFDAPAYRQQRIVYPLVAWAISLGRWQLTPTALIVANILAVLVLAYAAAAYALSVGRLAVAGIVMPLYPGYVFTVSRDLAELTEAALLVASLALLQRRRYGLATTTLCAGVLAKETLLVLPVTGLVLQLIRRIRGQLDIGPPWVIWLAPLALYAVWWGLLTQLWGTNPTADGGHNFGPPFTGLLQGMTTIPIGSPVWNVTVVELALIVAMLVSVLITCRSHLSSVSILTTTCAVYAVAALTYTNDIWIDDTSFMRVLHELFLIAGLTLVVAGRSVLAVLGLGAFGVWLWLALTRGSMP
jgi:hypothetical protein